MDRAGAAQPAREQRMVGGLAYPRLLFWVAANLPDGVHCLHHLAHISEGQVLQAGSRLSKANKLQCAVVVVNVQQARTLDLM